MAFMGGRWQKQKCLELKNTAFLKRLLIQDICYTPDIFDYIICHIFSHIIGHIIVNIFGHIIDHIFSHIIGHIFGHIVVILVVKNWLYI